MASMNLISPVLGLSMALLLCGCLHTGSPTSPTVEGGGGPPDALRFSTEVVTQGEIHGDIRQVEVVNQWGELRIRGTDSDTGSWTSTLRVRTTDAGAFNAVAPSATTRAVTNGQVLRITFDAPKLPPQSTVQSDIEVRVPRSVIVRSSNRFGPVVLDGLSSDVEVQAANGSVVLEDIGGSVTATTSFASMKVSRTGTAHLVNRNGSIEARDIRGPLAAKTEFAPLEVHDVAGGVSLSNRNGAIAASGVHGPASAETSFASLDLDADAPSIECRNRNGGLQIRARSTALTHLVAETSFAPLEVRLPSGLNPQVAVESSFGKVEADLPVLLNSTGSHGIGVVGEPVLRLKNRNGDIRLKRD